MKAKFFATSEFFPLKALLLLPLVALFFGGCSTPDYSAVMAGPDSESTNGVPVDRLQIGDTVTISFEGPPDPWPTIEKTINEDDTISLDQIGPIKAAGLTTGDLGNVITTNYVPRIVNHLNVTVKAGTRVFYVRGEVKAPGRQEYVGQITVTKAITSAGDFGDFADRKNVILVRANGQRFKLNCVKILNGDAPDPGVYPGDQIDVKRRNW